MELIIGTLCIKKGNGDRELTCLVAGDLLKISVNKKSTKFSFHRGKNRIYFVSEGDLEPSIGFGFRRMKQSEMNAWIKALKQATGYKFRRVSLSKKVIVFELVAPL